MRHPPAASGRFIGRAAELAELVRTFRRARGGHRQLVLISGEAGIGKTALCERAAERATTDGMTVVWGRCWPHGGAPPMWPWPHVLADMLGAQAERLLAGDLDSPTIDPERFARFAAIAEAVGAGCVQAPTVLILDDAHKADGGALLLTRFLVRAFDRVPLAIVLVRRSEAAAAGPTVDGLLDELATEANLLPLRRFDLADTLGYLEAHGVSEADSRLGQALLRITGGNPLLLSLAVTQADPSPHGLSRVENAIGNAIDRLPAGSGQALAQLAVLGLSASPREVAALSGDAASTTLEALSLACDAGLIEISPQGRAEFVHELVRHAAIGKLTPADRCAAHARAATLLAGDTRPAQLARRAHHALAASGRCDADAVEAIDASLAAARALAAGFDYEGCAALLAKAVELTDSVSRDDQTLRAAVLIESAEAVLACGRLSESRVAFDSAMGAAAATGDPALVARAALGLGGMWVHEHRDTFECARVLATQRGALARLPEHERGLRARLRVRLAAEEVYSGGSAARALEELARAREVGDAGVLAEAISLTHHALLAPKYATMRLELADELIVSASAAGDGVLALFGLLWRTVDLYQLGEHAAEHSLAELRARADALCCRHVLFIVEAMDVMRLIRAGTLAEAEHAAKRCYESGLGAGDADATGYYAGQLLTIRWIQGREDELLEDITGAANSPTLIAAEFALRASAAMSAARAGAAPEARAALRELSRAGLATLPTSSTWLTGMTAVIETAVSLGDAATAREAAVLIEPFAELPVMPSLAISCLGSAHRPLGLAAAAAGEADTAVSHQESALEANLRIGNRPLVALTRADLAAALVARDTPGDLERARGLLTEAHADAVAMGLQVRASDWAARLDRLGARRGLKACLLLRSGRWLLSTDGHETGLGVLVGFGYLAALLEHPGQDLRAVELCMTGAVETGRQTMLDTTALEQYRMRIAELDSELTAASAHADLARTDSLTLERDALLAQLGSAVGLGGRIRVFGDSAERARTAVHKAIKRALRCITEAESELGTQLARTVQTGNICRYDPDPAAVHWKVLRE